MCSAKDIFVFQASICIHHKLNHIHAHALDEYFSLDILQSINLPLAHTLPLFQLPYGIRHRIVYERSELSPFNDALNWR